ncbi:MAG: hypothetical protein NTW49_10225 [Bacteroidia bacterium]|nr:hypothetical protein [Bacteroidia bacterium]
MFNYEQYSQLFSNKTYYLWNQLWQIINYTKSYRQGIEIALILQNKFEEYRFNFSEKEQNNQIRMICTVYLNMLDKADLWEDYLNNWEIIKENSIKYKIGDEYINDSRSFHFSNGGEDFFLENTKRGFRLSFLYGLHHRKDLIKYKLE